LLCLGAAEGAGKRRCGLSLSLSLSAVKVKVSNSNHSGKFFWQLQVIALKTGACWLHKLCLKQANSLSSVKMLWLTAHCFASQT